MLATEFGASQDHVELADKDGIEGSHVDTEIPADEILQDGWSCSTSTSNSTSTSTTSTTSTSTTSTSTSTTILVLLY